HTSLFRSRHFARLNDRRTVNDRPDVAMQTPLFQPPAHALQLDRSAHAIQGGQFKSIALLTKQFRLITRGARLKLEKITLHQTPGALKLVELCGAGIGGRAGTHRAVQNLPGQGADHREDSQRNHDLQQGKSALASRFLHLLSPGGMMRREITGWLSSLSAYTRRVFAQTLSAVFTRCLRQFQLRPPMISVPCCSASGKS